MINAPQFDQKRIPAVLSKKLKIQSGININPNPLEEFKQKIIKQSTIPTLTQTDQEPTRESEVEIPIEPQEGENTEKQIDSNLKDKIKLANEVSNSNIDNMGLDEVISEPLTSEYYVVQFAGLDIETLRSKLQEFQKPETAIQNKELQIEAVQKLIKENIEAAEKINGGE